MTEPLERLDLLISRRLDGELTPDESVELNAMLRENPEAHALLAQAEQIDRTAKEALRRAIPAGGAPPFVPAQRTGRRREWVNPALITAIAACLAMVLLMRGSLSPLPPAPPSGGTAPTVQQHSAPIQPTFIVDSPEWSPTQSVPALQQHQMNKRYLGIKDPATGRYILLERRERAVRTERVSGSI